MLCSSFIHSLRRWSTHFTNIRGFRYVVFNLRLRCFFLEFFHKVLGLRVWTFSVCGLPPFVSDWYTNLGRWLVYDSRSLGQRRVDTDVLTMVLPLDEGRVLFLARCCNDIGAVQNLV